MSEQHIKISVSFILNKILRIFKVTFYRRSALLSKK